MRYVGLIDCDNFFVSCERVFRPSLARRPVVVTSNNEGCAVAMSNEAKTLGITRGLPMFKARAMLRENGVVTVSGNHRLYGNLSARVMATIASIVPEIEIYSIDEAFIHFEETDSDTVEKVAREIVTTVRRDVGIPTSLGVAPTKTLAKIAARLAKKNPALRAVCLLPDEKACQAALEQTAVKDVWGIGRRLAVKLNMVGIDKAADLARLPKSRAERLLNIAGLRTWRELNGEPCVITDPEAAVRKQVCTTRTFSPSVTTIEKLEEAISRFMTTASRKLRRQKSAAKSISVFLQTNTYRKDQPQYCNSAYRLLEEPTGDQMTLIKQSLDALHEIYRDGLHYRRAGVIITDTIPIEAVQPSLFSSPEDRDKRRRLNTVIDTLNTEAALQDKIRVATIPSTTADPTIPDDLLPPS